MSDHQRYNNKKRIYRNGNRRIKHMRDTHSMRVMRIDDSICVPVCVDVRQKDYRVNCFPSSCVSVEDPVVAAIKENYSRIDERPNIDFSGVRCE